MHKQSLSCPLGRLDAVQCVWTVIVMVYLQKETAELSNQCCTPTHPPFYPFFNILFQTPRTRHRSHLFLLLPSNHDVFTAALIVVNNQIINQRWPLINRARVHVGDLLLTQCVIILMRICHCVSVFSYLQTAFNLPQHCHWGQWENNWMRYK